MLVLPPLLPVLLPPEVVPVFDDVVVPLFPLAGVELPPPPPQPMSTTEAATIERCFNCKRIKILCYIKK
ncbi:hypothetical protein MNB_SV-8-141 [hydrothermal vent metagenome]|uniref:Uncharacterized protein n=1 Tax=hydrothermal vent metagenome TaxID=652676 RepID=A0A1W1C8V0_9ZZZZ